MDEWEKEERYLHKVRNRFELKLICLERSKILELWTQKSPKLAFAMSDAVNRMDWGKVAFISMLLDHPYDKKEMERTVEEAEALSSLVLSGITD